MVGRSDRGLPRPSVLWFDADLVVHSGSDALLAAEVSLGRLNRDVPEEELNLFQFATRPVTEPGTCPPKIVRCEPIYTRFAGSRTTCQTAFSVRPSPQALPFLLTRRKSLPTVRFAA